MKRKNLTIMLAVLMSMVASAALAASDGKKVNGVYYNFYGYGACVTYGYSYKSGTNTYYTYNRFSGEYYYTGEVVIPDSVTYQGKTYHVVEIGEHAIQDVNTQVEKIIIPKSVRKISAYAFESCYPTDVYCYATEVPSADVKMASGFNYTENINHATLHVPKEAIEKYKRSCPWAYFDSICGIPDPVESLKLEKHNLTLNVKDSAKIGYEILPTYADNKEVKWYSSNILVATVDGEGVVTARKTGTCEIIATSKDNSEAKDTCILTVVRPVTGVTLDYSEYVLNGIGTAFELNVNLQPEDASNKNVVWASSNEDVCTVSSTGAVTAMGEGECVVTVETEDGGYTATCKVSVVVEHPVTGVALDYETYTLDGIGKSVQLAATIQPENADNKEVVWKSYNESVCVVSNGLVVATGYGTAMVSVTTADGNHMAFCTITVENKTSMSNVKAEDFGYKVYDAQGMEYSRLQKGVNIIRFSDGTTKKVLIK